MKDKEIILKSSDGAYLIGHQWIPEKRTVGTVSNYSIEEQNPKWKKMV